MSSLPSENDKGRAATKLSATMVIAVGDIQDRGGELVCWKGGFWTYEGCSVKSTENGPTGSYRVPEFYIGTNTISALLKRNILVVTERSASGYPIRVRFNGLPS